MWCHIVIFMLDDHCFLYSIYHSSSKGRTEQTVKTWIGHHRTRRLILVYTVCNSSTARLSDTSTRSHNAISKLRCKDVPILRVNTTDFFGPRQAKRCPESESPDQAAHSRVWTFTVRTWPDGTVFLGRTHIIELLVI